MQFQVADARAAMWNPDMGCRLLVVMAPPRDRKGGHWPTDQDHMYVDFIRCGAHGNGAARLGNTRWRRLTELRAGAAKSVFHFDVQGSVAKSTHSGIPWLRYLRRQLGEKVFFWPFDGWDIPPGRSAVVEVYHRAKSFA